MKIRNGFVSNSSSSSFVFIGRSVDAKYAFKNVSKENIYVKGIELSDSYDFFKLDKSYVNIVKGANVHYYHLDSELVDDIALYIDDKVCCLDIPQSVCKNDSPCYIYHAWSDNKRCTCTQEVRSRYSKKRSKMAKIEPLGKESEDNKFILGTRLEKFEAEVILVNGGSVYVFFNHYNEGVYYQNFSVFKSASVVKIDLSDYELLFKSSAFIDLSNDTSSFFTTDSVFLTDGSELPKTTLGKKVYYMERFSFFKSWKVFSDTVEKFKK